MRLGPVRWSVSHRTVGRVYSWVMPEQGAVLEELMDHLGETSRSILASRRLLVEHAASEDEDAAGHLRLLARLSEALEATEAASREARRLRDASQQHRTSS